MTKPLANQSKQRRHTHRVTVEIDLPAHSAQHAEMVVANSIRSAFYTTKILDSKPLQG